MSKQVFAQARVRLPPAVRAGDLIVVSGQTPAGPYHGRLMADVELGIDAIACKPQR